MQTNSFPSFIFQIILLIFKTFVSVNITWNHHLAASLLTDKIPDRTFLSVEPIGPKKGQNKDKNTQHCHNLSDRGLNRMCFLQSKLLFLLLCVEKATQPCFLSDLILPLNNYQNTKTQVPRKSVIRSNTQNLIRGYLILLI